MINETNSWFFERINSIDKPLAKLTKREKTQINKIIYSLPKLKQDIKKLNRSIISNEIEAVQNVSTYVPTPFTLIRYSS
jgi:hypothetical protein